MLEWSEEQQAAVSRAIGQFPRDSNDCAQLAQALLPIARKLDPAAHGLVVEPRGYALYIQPNCGPKRWRHHVTTSTRAHCVDALTGPQGHPEETYLDTHFDHPDAHEIRPVEDGEWEEL